MHILRHPLTVLCGVALGVVLGISNDSISSLFGVSNFAEIIAIPGQLYLYYLQMTVIPIVITAIASSLGKLIRNRHGAKLAGKIAFVLAICLALTAFSGMIFGIVGKPGVGLNENSRTLISNLITKQNTEGANGALEINLRSGKQVNTPPRGPGLLSFFRDMIPSNIFYALTMGSTMAIVFFSIVFGIAIGVLNEELSSLLIVFLSAIFEAFKKIINWSLYLLPFGLSCLMAKQVSTIGPQIFIVMSKFIIVYGAGTAMLFITATTVMWIRSGIKNPFKALSYLFEPIILAFVTQNSMAVIPSAINCMNKKLGFDSDAVDLTLPLCTTLGRFGNVFYFAIASFFVAQIYGTPLHLIQYVIIFFGVIFGGTATAGATGIVTLSMISIVLNPLSLPVEAVLVIFMAIDPIIDPLRTFLIVYMNMTVTSLVAKNVNHSKGAVNESVKSTFESKRHQKIKNIIARKKIKPMRIYYGIIIINSFFLVFSTAISIISMWNNTDKNTRTLAASLIGEIQNSVIYRTTNYFSPAQTVNQTLAFLINQAFDDPINKQESRDKLFLYYDHLKDLHQQFKMMYYANTSGNLIMLLRMSDGTFSKRFVYNTGSEIQIRYEHTNPAYYETYPNEDQPLETGYDPRKRLWYTMAEDAKTVAWTPVYIFATGNIPGFTCAAPIYDELGNATGVSCVDIALDELSYYLGTIRTTPGTKIVIMDKENKIVALQARQQGDLSDLFVAKQNSSGKIVYEVSGLDEFKDETMRSILRQIIQKPGTLINVEHENKKYDAIFTPFNVGYGLDLNIGVIVPEEDTIGYVHQSLIALTVFSIGVLALIIFVSSRIAEAISKPMRQLADEMIKVKAFNLDSDVIIKPKFLEIMTMNDSFESMRSGLRNFKRYVPADMVARLVNENISADLGGERQELTIFFSDIAKFTTISEKTTTDILVQDLCAYFEIISNIIMDNHGTIDKYIGDSVMAFWGAPVRFENHAERACTAAILVRNNLRNLFQKWITHGKTPFYTRIGIHTGEVLVGNIGYNERLNYTVIGDTVNVASRLEGINKVYGTSITVSEATRKQCKNLFEFRRLDKVSVLGQQKSFDIYELVAPSGLISDSLKKLNRFYETGLKYYFDKNWNKALNCFNTVLKYRPKDKPSSLMRERCMRYKEIAPPPDWDGVFIQDSK